MPKQRPYKIPVSVLVLIHTAALDVLLMRRAARSGTFWQSVTGSRRTPDEPLLQTAVREVREETGIDATAPDICLSDWHMTNTFEIAPEWGGHFAPGVTHNEEHVFALRVPAGTPVCLNPREHLEWIWLPWQEAAVRCWSWTNAKACRDLPAMASGAAT